MVKIAIITFFLITSQSILAKNDDIKFVKEKIDRLSSIITSEINELDRILERKGFTQKSSFFSLEYSEWSNYRKLETAYLMAEAADKNSGIKLLKSISLEIADRNIAITKEKILQDFFPERENTREIGKNKDHFKFKELKNSKTKNLHTEIPKEVSQIIERISIYTPSVPGGTAIAMAKCCNISEKKAFEIIRKSSSLSQALEMAIRTGALPPSLLERLKALYNFTKRNNKAVEFEIGNIDSYIKNKTELANKKNKKTETEKVILSKLSGEGIIYSAIKNLPLSPLIDKPNYSSKPYNFDLIPPYYFDLISIKNREFDQRISSSILENFDTNITKNQLQSGLVDSEYTNLVRSTQKTILEFYYQNYGPFNDQSSMMSSLKEGHPELYALLFLSYKHF